MITAVWGLINGYQTAPFANQGDRWYFDPPEEDGTYICEFWAEDEYGNIGYNAAILYVVSGVVKCIHVLSRRYATRMLAPRYKLVPTERRYTSRMKKIVCPHHMREER